PFGQAVNLPGSQLSMPCKNTGQSGLSAAVVSHPPVNSTRAQFQSNRPEGKPVERFCVTESGIVKRNHSANLNRVSRFPPARQDKQRGQGKSDAALCKAGGQAKLNGCVQREVEKD